MAHAIDFFISKRVDPTLLGMFRSRRSIIAGFPSLKEELATNLNYGPKTQLEG